ncbi:hypothetical protein NP233_g3101 [Leucocoprinus birnbaumii]|uniref:U2A'/phosphoprotein 32 family A C-terminal domain-containing protein n=1 Tax=Leucocoprinus birnbaumii TaxID=56174 RepID=A0AAD5VYL0_9AGAR|nr:hypothetical protein NP233_g3101 [Leucocoprinus birnbaumii]
MSSEEEKKVQVQVPEGLALASEDLSNPSTVTKATLKAVDGDVSEDKGKAKEGIDPSREEIIKSGPSARVVLPEPQGDDTLGVDSDEDDVDGQEGEEEQGDDGDFLSDFPDDTPSLDNLHLARFAGHLRKLCLRQNIISYLDPEVFHKLTLLEEIDLYDNKIKSVGDALEKLQNLTQNRITKLENLDTLTELDQLYLSHNGLQRLEGLEHNTQLTTLDVGNNFIPAIENIDHLVGLEELWMNGNKIPDLLSLDGQLRHIKTLRTLYLEANPCQESDRTGYRRKIMLSLPQLTQIDATYVRVSLSSVTSI